LDVRDWTLADAASAAAAALAWSAQWFTGLERGVTLRGAELG